MWVAQWPGGTWCAYKEKPILKMSGWEGKIYAHLKVQTHTINWRESLKELSYKDYQDQFRMKEVR